MNDYILKERKNMNLPGNRVLIDTLTEKDYYDLEYFVINNKIDFVSVSFCFLQLISRQFVSHLQ